MAVNLYSLSQDQVATQLKELGQPGFRSRQIWKWLYEQGAETFDEMTDLPKALRKALEENFQLGEMSLATEQRSRDGTIKRLYRLLDGQLIEAVLMPYADGRRTACISSQAGCAMGCVFCATGQMGFARQLAPHEIFEQAQLFSSLLRQRGERLSNVVLMGMGEPFHNYESVIAAVRMLMDRLGIGARRITISTVGLVPKIRRFAEEGLQVKLAISLHASNDKIRGALMPVNRKYPLSELIDACREYVAVSHRRITFEWALIAGENDSESQAVELGQLLQGLLCHVNLIPLNPTKGYVGRPTDPAGAEKFIAALARFGIPATLRVRRGIDIDAGCGQLRSSQEGGTG
jgi:23S rRNA (adenine2503-C2)-methyltransferase